MNEFVRKHGRKFTLAMYAISMGGGVTGFGIVMASAYPEAAGHIAAIVGSFSIILSVAVGAYSGAEGAADWKKAKLVPGKAPQISEAEPPAPRQSGMLHAEGES